MRCYGPGCTRASPHYRTNRPVMFAVTVALYHNLNYNFHKFFLGTTWISLIILFQWHFSRWKASPRCLFFSDSVFAMSLSWTKHQLPFLSALLLIQQAATDRSSYRPYSPHSLLLHSCLSITADSSCGIPDNNDLMMVSKGHWTSSQI